MFNLIFIIFTFLFLVYKKIFLLNEETLILLCFIIFIYLSSNLFGNFIELSLNNQSTNIKTILSNSINQLHILFKNFASLRNYSQIVLTKFLTLGNYYYELTSLLISLLPRVSNRKLVISYTKRLSFLRKVEQQTMKLLPLIIIKKLNKITKLRQFYNISLKNNYFLCINNTLLREYIKLVSVRK
uniref:ATP synthase B chain n=1 Tax=Lithothamnion sp. TaxID=1940749 RepID=A0A3G3MIB3_9FLOR|nr:ATP synthase B chain precursor [Lithothamnion sp.]